MKITAFLWSQRLSILMFLLVITTAVFMLSKNYGWLPFLSWIAALYLLIFIYKKQPKFKLPNRILSPEMLTASLFIFLAYICRVVLLGLQPSWIPFHGDEAIISKNAVIAIDQGMVHGEWQLLATLEGTLSWFPALWYYISGFFMRIFGPSLYTAKLFALLSDMGISFCIFYLAHKWWGRLPAFVSLTFYLSFPLAIHFSMTGYQNIQSTLFLFLTLVYIDAAARHFAAGSHKTNYYLLLGGIMSGLGMYFYLSSLVTPVLALGWVLLWFKSKPINLPKFIGIFLLGFFVASIPFWIYSFTEYNFVTGRSIAFDVSSSTGGGDNIWLLQARETLAGFHFQNMNGSGEHYIYLPALPHILGFGLFVLGLIGRLIITRWHIATEWRSSIALWSILVVTLISGAILTENPPAPQRLLHIFPVIALFIGGAIADMQTVLRIFSLKKVVFPSAVLILLLLLVSNLYSYFTQNIPAYANQPHPEYQLVRHYQQSANPLPVVSHIPRHKNAQIYFYSQGQLEPIDVLNHIELENWISPQGVIFLADEEGEKMLQFFTNITVQPLDWKTQPHYQVFLLQTPTSEI